MKYEESTETLNLISYECCWTWCDLLVSDALFFFASLRWSECCRLRLRTFSTSKSQTRRRRLSLTNCKREKITSIDWWFFFLSLSFRVGQGQGQRRGVSSKFFSDDWKYKTLRQSARNVKTPVSTFYRKVTRRWKSERIARTSLWHVQGKFQSPRLSLRASGTIRGAGLSLFVQFG